MINRIKALSKAYSEEFIQVRRHLHAHPELSFEEWNTSIYIQEKLKNWDIPFEVLANTGVCGIIEGKNPNSRTVALRADMDALPIEEENQVEYKSTNKGIMHACGHDVHTTCLLGAAKILVETKGEWEGTVKLIFQPGEEKNPGGASLMIKAGVLENPKPEKIFALHVHPGLNVGKFSFRGGKVMASADEIYITIKATGGHAAAPQFTADSILIASHIIIALQQVVSRNNDPFNPSVLSITSIHGGNTTNVIPSEVKMMGTFRAMDESWRFKAHGIIKKITEEIALAMGAEVDVTIDVGYPFVYNHPELSEATRKIAEDFMDTENVSETELRMGGEDFAFYTHHIPGCFFRLGVRNEASEKTHALHTPNFNVDEKSIEHGMGMMAWIGAMG